MNYADGGRGQPVSVHSRVVLDRTSPNSGFLEANWRRGDALPTNGAFR